MRKGALNRLENAGITQENYSPSKHHFINLEACFLELNELYDTYHSFADLNKFKD